MQTILYERKDLDAKPNAPVSRVTVYQGRAHVMRRKKCDLKKGLNRATITALGSGIEEDNIKAMTGTPAARVTSLLVHKKNLYFFNKKENEAAYQEVMGALEKLIRLFDHKTVLAVEAGLIADLRLYLRHALGEILLQQNVAITRLKEALDFLKGILEQNRNDAITTDDALADAEREYRRLATALQKIHRLDKKKTHVLELELECDADVSIELEVSYMITGASWNTSYDAFLDTAAKKLVLSVYGEITQSTGEDWNEAEIVLSSAPTEEGIAIPAIYPVTLSGYEETISRDIVVESEETDEMGATGEEALPQPLKESAVEKKGTSYTFTLPAPAAILCDGLAHRLLLRRETCKPSVSFETIPSEMEYVYLKAVSQSALPLLAGPVMIFRNGSYIGRTEIKYTAPGEECALSFGIDEEIKVKRIILLDEYMPPRGLGARHKREFSYRYILSHYKEAAVRVVVKEAIHVSEVDKISVKIGKDTTEGYQLDRDGIVSFEKELPPGKFERTAFLLHYSIEAPKSFSLENV